VSTFPSSILACILFFMNQSARVDARPQASGTPDTKSIQSAVSCSDTPYAKELPPPGPACENELFARRGRPVMFPARNGIALGVSSSPDKHSALYLWADNRTSEAVTFYVCCVVTLFDNIDIFDSEGHRVLSRADQAEQKARSEGLQTEQICTCSGWSVVPPHTIQLVASADISDGCTLQPGRYTISERNPPALYNLKTDDHAAAPHDQPGLVVSMP
jgi:hypothetical protein